jgi:hypothetical protein
VLDPAHPLREATGQLRRRRERRLGIAEVLKLDARGLEERLPADGLTGESRADLLELLDRAARIALGDEDPRRLDARGRGARGPRIALLDQSMSMLPSPPASSSARRNTASASSGRSRIR